MLLYNRESLSHVTVWQFTFGSMAGGHQHLKHASPKLPQACNFSLPLLILIVVPL